VFLTQSVEIVENKRVESFVSTKKCKRVRKNVKRRRILNAEREKCVGKKEMHEYQKKRLTEFVSRKWLILKDMFGLYGKRSNRKRSPRTKKSKSKIPDSNAEHFLLGGAAIVGVSGGET